MMKVLSMKSADVAGFRISGKLHTCDLESAISHIKEKCNDRPKVRLYVEVGSFGGMSMKALIKDIRFALTHHRDFEREVVVTNKRWLELLADLGNKFFPNIEVRHYRWTERNRAEEWICN